MSKEQCSAGDACPQRIQEACDEVYRLYGEYPCNDKMQRFMTAEIEAVAQQVQQEQLEGDNL